MAIGWFIFACMYFGDGDSFLDSEEYIGRSLERIAMRSKSVPSPAHSNDLSKINSRIQEKKLRKRTKRREKYLQRLKDKSGGALLREKPLGGANDKWAPAKTRKNQKKPHKKPGK